MTSPSLFPTHRDAPRVETTGWSDVLFVLLAQAATMLERLFQGPVTVPPCPLAFYA
jgi:hypothetical protein